MCSIFPTRHRGPMTTAHTPLDAATAVLAHPTLPPGDDERFVGFGVMGFPFTSGHYLALRHFPATTFAPAYRSVWHRDPAGIWTFYATTPAEQSCARYFSSATPQDAVKCDIDVAWTDPWTLHVAIPGLLDWTIQIQATAATRLLSAVGQRLPVSTWTNKAALTAIGFAAGTLLRSGTMRLSATAPNGQQFMVAPQQVWRATGRAAINGVDLGRPGPLDRQARLGGFRPPQRALFVVASGHFENFDPSVHRAAEHTVSLD